MSDKDFFFDEEPEQPARDKSAPKPGAKPVTKAGAKPTRSESSEPEVDKPLLERDTTVMVAVLSGVVGLLLGLIIGFLLLGGAPAQPAASAPAGSLTATSTSGN